jgi:hypothetical protein
LAAAIDGWDLLAIFFATFIASSTRRSDATTRDTKPLAAASYASIISPVKINSIALDFPIA